MNNNFNNFKKPLPPITVNKKDINIGKIDRKFINEVSGGINVQNNRPGKDHKSHQKRNQIFVVQHNHEIGKRTVSKK